MDIIYLNDLRIDALIGVYDWERRLQQTLIFDLEMATDIRPAAASDDIADTLDYGAVATRLQEFVGNSEFQLIETLAERMTGIILQEFDVSWVRLKVNKKGAVRGVRDVGLIIERGQR